VPHLLTLRTVPPLLTLLIPVDPPVSVTAVWAGDGPQGCKTRHFGNIQKASGVGYREMIFFDDGMYNCRDVNPLGVLSVCVPDGMTLEVPFPSRACATGSPN
jgi:hypothetical protein